MPFSTYNTAAGSSSSGSGSSGGDGRPDRPLVVKCTFDRWNKRITFSSARNCSYELLREKVEQCFSLSASSFIISYKDDDGEVTDITTESDLTEALTYFQSDDPSSSGASILSGRSSTSSSILGRRKITLRVQITVDYDGPSLSDSSSLASLEEYRKSRGSEVSLSLSGDGGFNVGGRREMEDDEVTISSRDTGNSRDVGKDKHVPQILRDIDEEDDAQSQGLGSQWELATVAEDIPTPSSQPSSFAHINNSAGPSSSQSPSYSSPVHLSQTERGAAWLRDQNARTIKAMLGALPEPSETDTASLSLSSIAEGDDECDDGDGERLVMIDGRNGNARTRTSGDLALRRDQRGKYYYSYTSSSTGDSGYDDSLSVGYDTRSSRFIEAQLNRHSRSEPALLGEDSNYIHPSIPPEVLKFVNGGEDGSGGPDEVTSCSECGVLLEGIRYVCATCGEKKAVTREELSTGFTEDEESNGSVKGKVRGISNPFLDVPVEYPPGNHRTAATTPSSSANSSRTYVAADGRNGNGNANGYGVLQSHSQVNVHIQANMNSYHPHDRRIHHQHHLPHPGSQDLRHHGQHDPNRGYYHDHDPYQHSQGYSHHHHRLPLPLPPTPHSPHTFPTTPSSLPIHSPYDRPTGLPSSLPAPSHHHHHQHQHYLSSSPTSSRSNSNSNSSGSSPVTPTYSEGYELCSGCIESAGVNHALELVGGGMGAGTASSSSMSSSSSSSGMGMGGNAQLNLSQWRRTAPRLKGQLRHAFLEKVWGPVGWEDVEQDDRRTCKCSTCGTDIVNKRYKCASCQDVNLCRACYSQVHEVHPSHAFLFVPDKPARSFSESDVRTASSATVEVDVDNGEMSMKHPGVKCAHCMQDIVGARFHCAICESVDICANCESAGLPGNLDSSDDGHNSSHIMIKIPYPLETTEVQTASKRAKHLWTGRDAAIMGCAPAKSCGSGSPTSSSHAQTVVGSSKESGHSGLKNHNILCNGCGQSIKGIRYQCASCPSSPNAFSLCMICEERSYLLHDPMHIFFKLPSPVDRPLESPTPLLPKLYKIPAGTWTVQTPMRVYSPKDYLKSVLHTHTWCDRCMTRIQGEWFRCAYCDKDLCVDCEAMDTHDITHVFMVFKSTVDMQVFRRVADLDNPNGVVRPIIPYPVYRS